MPELRKDPIIGRWVIISTERGKRPGDFPSVETVTPGGFCPFDAGNEDKTPPEVFAFREPGTEPNTPGWRVRVVPNKFPALRIEGPLIRRGEGVFDKMSGIGAHEVVIENPDHGSALCDLALPQVEEVVRAFIHRIKDLRKDERLRYILVFKNHGEQAGASLEHSHTQIIATPIVPKRVMEELNGARQHYDLKERCIFCDIVLQEMEDGIRLVTENEACVSLTPFASRFPFETWLLPKWHSSRFEDMTDSQITSVADLLLETLLRLRSALNAPPYNFIIHTGPCQDPELPFYHWHIEIIPKLTKIAGFEWGTGFYINPTLPEEAARYLREVSLDAAQAGGDLCPKH
ncbi:MAG: galactose-1-phosphate uridylyltransferase [Candidatus Eisenbacteria sp.]|nr:galactose-1-phosphate uridylyltransferase [Candidatus Eisenbacteria bacterium]